LKIWVDADAAPREVKEILFRAAKRLDIEIVLVANQPMWTPPGDAVSSVTVREGANVADRYIVTHSEAGDLTISADIPLAADLVEKGVAVIDPRGDEYTRDNIAGRLSTRNFMDDLRGAGVTTRGSRPYDNKDKQAFASALDRFLTKAMRERSKRDGG
jgi:uncharacterized protein YaiI (UPF0178 family)